jgi:hypothetical protein
VTNITKFPNHQQRRALRNLKNGIVECQVSGRWLKFPEKASEVDGKGFMMIDVMTLGSGEQPRKICELVLTKEDLIAMLNKIDIIS